MGPRMPGWIRVAPVLALLGLGACATAAGRDAGVRSPDTASRLRVAAAAESSGHVDVALSMYAAVAAAAPGDAEVQARYAGALGRSGQVDEAGQVLHAALQRQPNNERLLTAFGQTRIQAGAAAEALVAFDQALAVAPRNAAALNGKGIALDLLGRHADAQQSYRTALVLDPANIAATNNQAVSLLLSGQPQQAAELLAPLRWRRNAPERVLVNLGIATAASGDKRVARDILADRIDSEDLGHLTDALGAGARTSR